MRYKPLNLDSQWYAVLFDGQKKLRAVAFSTHADALRFCTRENANRRRERAAERKLALLMELAAITVKRD